jgi:hypothetical protein
MTDITKQFFANNKKYEFIFKKIYYHPEILKVFLKYDREQYYKLPIYYYLLLNNHFLDFLNNAIEYDEDFLCRLDIEILMVLENVLLNNQSIREEYFEVHDGTGEMSYTFFKTATNFQKAFNKPLDEKARYYNWDFSDSLSDQITELQERVLAAKEGKEIISEILECTKEDICYLENADDITIFYALVCNNDFVSLIEEMFNKRQLSLSLIDKAKKIISSGIEIKTLVGKGVIYQQKLIGEERVRSFDLKAAGQLLTKLIIFEERSLLKSKPLHLTLIKSEPSSQKLD